MSATNKRPSQVGSRARNFYEGSRSEYLAQYVFSSFGSSVAVPHQEDHGVDFFCTLMEKIGRREWAKASYTVQIKSALKPWIFASAKSVEWLIRHPLPLFLGVIDKKNSTLHIYHTVPRYSTWMRGDLPTKMVMTPTMETVGQFADWTEDYNFSLSAPILNIEVARLRDYSYWKNARSVLESWIELENHNLTLIRAGIYRFRRPSQYETNSLTKFRDSIVDSSFTRPSKQLLKTAIRHVSECLDYISNQFQVSEKHLGAVEAGLLYRYFRQEFSGFFEDNDSGVLSIFNELFNKLSAEKRECAFSGIDEIKLQLERVLKENFEN